MPTQREVVKHLDLKSTRYVRELRDQGSIPDPAHASLDEIRISYIRHIREVAAGRLSKDGTVDLAHERGLLARVQREREAMKNDELRGELLPRDEVVRVVISHIVAAKVKLRAIPKKARTRIRGLTIPMARQLAKLIDEVLHDLAGDVIPKKPRRKRA